MLIMHSVLFLIFNTLSNNSVYILTNGNWISSVKYSNYLNSIELCSIVHVSEKLLFTLLALNHYI